MSELHMKLKKIPKKFITDHHNFIRIPFVNSMYFLDKAVVIHSSFNTFTGFNQTIIIYWKPLNSSLISPILCQVNCSNHATGVNHFISLINSQIWIVSLGITLGVGCKYHWEWCAQTREIHLNITHNYVQSSINSLDPIILSRHIFNQWDYNINKFVILVFSGISFSGRFIIQHVTEFLVNNSTKISVVH
jgi:hypothetical protein